MHGIDLTDQVRAVRAFNEWMRRFIEDPSGFKGEWQDVQVFLKERDAGKEPSYGEACDAYLRKLLAEIE